MVQSAFGYSAVLAWLTKQGGASARVYFAIFGYVYFKISRIFQYFRLFISFHGEFLWIFPFFKFEHCVIVKGIFKKPWSHFQLLIGKIRFEIPKPRQDPPSHFHNSNSILIYISPMTFLDYFMFNRDKSKLAMVSRIMSCRHVSIIGN